MTGGESEVVPSGSPIAVITYLLASNGTGFRWQRGRLLSATALLVAFMVTRSQPLLAEEAPDYTRDGAGGARESSDATRVGADDESPGRADKPWAVGVTAAEKEAALRLFRRGNTFFERERFSSALASYKEAVRLWDHPAIRYNMAICFIHQEDHVQAWESLGRALRFGRGPLSVDKHRQALTYRRLLRGRLGSITVACEEEGVEITLDGLPLGLAQGMATRMVGPGAHQLVASKAGHITWKQTLALRGGETRRVTVRLVSLEAALGARRRWSQALPWSVAAAGAAMVTAGVALVLVARADADRFNERLEDLCPAGCVRREPLPGEEVIRMPASLVSLEARVKAEHYSGVSLLCVGGAALVTGITLLLLNQPRPLGSGESASPASPASPVPPASPSQSGFRSALSFEVTPGFSPRGAHIALTLRF